MKFQQLALTGLFALATTITAQSAAFSAQLPTQLTSDDVAAIGINTPRNPELNVPHMMTSMHSFSNPTHPTALEVGKVAQ